MLARVISCAVIGLDGVVVEVEVDTGQGLPKITIVGLPDAAVQESKERVQSAIKNAGLYFPRKKMTVNLAPASVRNRSDTFGLSVWSYVKYARRIHRPCWPSHAARCWFGNA